MERIVIKISKEATMRFGKWEVKLLLRFQSLWMGIYPNTIRGKCCIAFLPFCILRIINTEKHWQDENKFLKEAMRACLAQLKEYSDNELIIHNGVTYPIPVLAELTKEE